MKPYDVYISYISWGDEGKRRPVLVLSIQDAQVSILRITTQYENKSVTIRSKYLIINDWQQAGLYMQSYIDTNKVIDLPITTLDTTPIGRLSKGDRQ